jgi:hypothetical protein
MKNLKINLLISVFVFVILSCSKPETKLSNPNQEILKDSVSTSTSVVDSKDFPEEESLSKLQSYLNGLPNNSSKSYRILGWREISENEVSIYYQVRTNYDNGNDNFETTRVYRLKNKGEYIWILATGSYGTSYSIINKQK